MWFMTNDICLQEFNKYMQVGKNPLFIHLLKLLQVEEEGSETLGVMPDYLRFILSGTIE